MTAIDTDQHEASSTLSPSDNDLDYLRADSPLIIEEDDDLTSFFQRETSLDPSSSSSPVTEFSALHPDHVLSNAPGRGIGGPENARLTPFTVMLVLTACISGLLFGYDTGVISSTLVSIGTELTAPDPLGILDKSLITSCTSLFALLASPLGGWLADRWGRKSVIIVTSTLFVVGAILQAWAGSVLVMIIGRSVVGVAVGVASLVVPLYISELAPAEFRGRLVVMNVLFITGGQMLAYLLGWCFAHTASGWRYMVGFGALPAAMQLCALMVLPESPRWLVCKGRNEEARLILGRVYGQQKSALVDKLVKSIAREVLEEEDAFRSRGVKRSRTWLSRRPEGWTELFSVPSNRRALSIACLLQGLQQLCGFNSLMYFSSLLMLQIGFQNPILASFTVAGTNFLFTLLAMTIIDKVGRRRILLVTVPFMSIGLLLSALSFSFISAESASAVTFSASASNESPSIWSFFSLVAITIYVAAYATGIGNVPWQQSELFPVSVRALGCGVSTATGWASNFVVGLTFLPFMELLGSSLTFVMYSGICGLGWILVYRIYPETKGLALEDVVKLLKEGWGTDPGGQRRRS